LASVLLGLDDPQVGRDLVAALEEAGHQVKWVPALDVTPGAVKSTPDAIVVDADAPGMDLNVVHASWRRREPPPSLVVLGSTQKDRMEAERLHARFLAKPVVTDQVRDEMARLHGGARGNQLLSSASALRALGLVGGGLPEDEAALIVAGARSVDVTLVREALRPHIFDYAQSTRLVDRLCQRRTLGPEEAKVGVALDGGRTIRGVIDGLPRSADDTTPLGALAAHQAARLLWALASSGAVQLSKEPPAGHPTARLRAHLRARRALGNVTHYQVLEVGLHATAAEIDRAFALAQLRYGPDALAQHDLAELVGVAAQIWEQLQRAYAVLGHPRARADYDGALVPRQADLHDQRERRRLDADEAERTFLRGQQALAQGDVFRAMSELAAAARRFPAHPEYDAFAAWARLLADEARGGDRRQLAERERPRVEQPLLGRRPWPRALYVLGLLCEASGDPGGAAIHLREALAGDEKLGAARQALQRVLGR
jgi:DNA-binding response OmpR family regulator/tetratricopeptide (TPR) repeat protein